MLKKPHKFIAVCVFVGLIVLVVYPVESTALVEYPGKPGAYLRMGIGSRPMGIGGAYAGVANDIYSVIYNPGGLASIENREIALSLKILSMDRRHSFFGMASPIGQEATYALYWVNAGTNNVPEMDLSGNWIGSLRDNKNAFGLCFARKLTGNFSLGFGFKYLLHNLAGEQARGYGFDIGFLFKPVAPLSIGVLARDISSRLTWRTNRWEEVMEKEEHFPSIYSLGISYEPINEVLLIAIQGDIWPDTQPLMHAGVEYRYNRKLHIRGGIHGFSGDDGIETASWVMGLTILEFPFSTAFRTEYTYVTDPLGIGDEHVISFVFSY